MRFGSTLGIDMVCQDMEAPVGKESSWYVYIHGLVLGLLSGPVLHVLRQHFRWCEVKSAVPSVAYFTKPVWNKLTHKYICDMKLAVLAPITPPLVLDLFQHRTSSAGSDPVHNENWFRLSPGVARLVFKSEQGAFRLVINANAKRCPDWITFQPTVTNPTPFLSMNDRLRLCGGLSEFLARLRVELPSLFRPSLLSLNSAFECLQSYQKVAYSAGRSTFSIAKLDLMDCFHQIDHSRLLEIFKHACAYGERFMYPAPNTEHLVKELEWFLNDTVITFQGRPYRFARGLFQGSCISSELVNLYLAYADRQLAKSITLWASTGTKQFAEVAAFRYQDDYLCVASSKEALRNLIDRLQSNLHDFGLAINQSKMQSNLDNTVQSITWLGMEVRNDLHVNIPEAAHVRFCRFSGRPSSAALCIRHLDQCYLKCSIWRFAFTSPRNMSPPSQVGLHRWRLLMPESSSLSRIARFQDNAHRLGCKLAERAWVAIKTSPQRTRLLKVPMVKQLAAIVARRLISTLGRIQADLVKTAAAAFQFRLRAHRGEVHYLLKHVRRRIKSFLLLHTVKNKF
ncbi:unnamed protein product [Dicrocoelium dendriticum]|nr:unnamed protein product [Dicrocoelium dendriticum]